MNKIVKTHTVGNKQNPGPHLRTCVDFIYLNKLEKAGEKNACRLSALDLIVDTGKLGSLFVFLFHLLDIIKAHKTVR